MGDGIYKSTDGGQNWKNMGLPKSDRISSIIVDPKNSDIVWVGVLPCGEIVMKEVFIKQQTGNHLEQSSFVDNKTGCSDLIIDPKNSAMYASLGI
jgi:hypothetical protein